MPSLRVNTLRISREELKQLLESKYGFEVQEVPWYSAALVVKAPQNKTHNPITRFGQSNKNALLSLARPCEPTTQLPEYHYGYFYLQSLASMLPVIALDPQPGETVLDLCAAPGSKTTQIAMHMQNKGMLVANDSSYLRLKPLRSHLQRLGISGCTITCYDGRRFPPRQKFHRVLLDAPCSGTGSRHAHSNYSPNRLNQMAKLQKQLLVHAFDLLRPGGRLVYSTCTTREEENEQVVQHLLNKRSEAKVEKPVLPGLGPWAMGSGPWGIRVQPDELFFIAQIEKV